MTTEPALMNTDDALPDIVLAAVRQCAAAWEPGCVFSAMFVQAIWCARSIS